MSAFALDAETRALEAPDDHRAELRLWLRLLSCANLVEGDVRRRLRADFDVTLPRFDLLAQLARAPEGMTMGELSRRMMVSNGNLTALVGRMVLSGHVDRRASAADKRAQMVRLTARGRRDFARLAARHGDWIAALFAGLDKRDVEALSLLLAKMKSGVQSALARRDP